MKKFKDFLVNAVLFVLPLSLIGYGFHLIHPAAAYISVGVLFWVDINIIPLFNQQRN